MITIAAYLMGRDVKYKSEYSDSIYVNGCRLLLKVNRLLHDLGFDDVEVSSGWRPPSVNHQVPGAAVHSHHMTGNAVDIMDTQKQLAQAILKYQFIDNKFLEKYGLYMEDPQSTLTWVHLQDIAPKSGKRIFNP